MAAKKKATKLAATAGPSQPARLHDLLDEAAFRVRLAGGTHAVLTLPGVLAALGGGAEVESFTSLQAHQTHPWHAFLVQLAAIALHRAGESSPALSEAAWKERLLALTEGAHEPWCLVAGDLAKPAFMQPPVPEGTLAEFKQQADRADEVDVLITAKNHDQKASRIGRPRPEHWVFALVSLQTMQGFSGRANYGIARMKDSFASRPGVSMLAGLSWSARFGRELGVLLDRRPTMSEAYPADDGPALLWLLPWKGAASEALSLGSLDPYFIEICRRRRLVVEGGRLVARETGTDAPRIGGKELLGRTGDPWTPISRDDAGAYRPRNVGFPYEQAVQLLVGSEYESSATQRVLPTDPPAMWLGLWAFVRGQGKTEGLHERLISLPGKVRRALVDDERRAVLAQRAQARVKRASVVGGDVLRPALKVYLQAAPEKLKLEDDRPQRWTQAFSRSVDDMFFAALFADLDAPAEVAELAFDQRLFDLARAQLELAMAGSPVPAARRPRAIAAAERAFYGRARKLLPNLFPTMEPDAGAPSEALS